MNEKHISKLKFCRKSTAVEDGSNGVGLKQMNNIRCICHYHDSNQFEPYVVVDVKVGGNCVYLEMRNTIVVRFVTESILDLDNPILTKFKDALCLMYSQNSDAFEELTQNFYNNPSIFSKNMKTFYIDIIDFISQSYVLK
jgi:hypothetical protein